MTDRELLELAAKAAGIEVVWCATGTMLLPATKSNEGCDEWNPLTDDGDALRLAVKLGMNLEVTDSTIYACTMGNCSEPAKPDPYAAARRAIVRAAAEI